MSTVDGQLVMFDRPVRRRAPAGQRPIEAEQPRKLTQSAPLPKWTRPSFMTTAIDLICDDHFAQMAEAGVSGIVFACELARAAASVRDWIDDFGRHVHDNAPICEYLPESVVHRAWVTAIRKAHR